MWWLGVVRSYRKNTNKNDQQCSHAPHSALRRFLLGRISRSLTHHKAASWHPIVNHTLHAQNPLGCCRRAMKWPELIKQVTHHVLRTEPVEVRDWCVVIYIFTLYVTVKAIWHVCMAPGYMCTVILIYVHGQKNRALFLHQFSRVFSHFLQYVVLGCHGYINYPWSSLTYGQHIISIISYFICLILYWLYNKLLLLLHT